MQECKNKVYTEDKGTKPVDEAKQEFGRIERVVAGIKVEIDKTLPLLWNKREYAINEDILYQNLKACS